MGAEGAKLACGCSAVPPSQGGNSINNPGLRCAGPGLSPFAPLGHVGTSGCFVPPANFPVELLRQSLLFPLEGQENCPPKAFPKASIRVRCEFGMLRVCVAWADQPASASEEEDLDPVSASIDRDYVGRRCGASGRASQRADIFHRRPACRHDCGAGQSGDQDAQPGPACAARAGFQPGVHARGDARGDLRAFARNAAVGS